MTLTVAYLRQPRLAFHAAANLEKYACRSENDGQACKRTALRGVSEHSKGSEQLWNTAVRIRLEVHLRCLSTDPAALPFLELIQEYTRVLSHFGLNTPHDHGVGCQSTGIGFWIRNCHWRG